MSLTPLWACPSLKSLPQRDRPKEVPPQSSAPTALTTSWSQYHGLKSHSLDIFFLKGFLPHVLPLVFLYKVEIFGGPISFIDYGPNSAACPKRSEAVLNPRLGMSLSANLGGPATTH